MTLPDCPVTAEQQAIYEADKKACRDPSLLKPAPPPEKPYRPYGNMAPEEIDDFNACLRSDHEREMRGYPGYEWNERR